MGKAAGARNTPIQFVKAILHPMMTAVERLRDPRHDEFRSAFEHAGVGMAMTDGEDRFVRVNRKFADMLGYSVKDMLGADADIFTAGDYRAESGERRRALMTAEVDEITADRKLVHRDGSQVW